MDHNTSHLNNQYDRIAKKKKNVGKIYMKRKKKSIQAPKRRDKKNRNKNNENIRKKKLKS